MAGGMLKRQESLLSSSSRRETLPENHDAKAVGGCMAGVFRLVSKYQSRRKLLTFGRKQEKMSKVSSFSNTANREDKNRKGDQICDFRRLSCNVPRSPALPADIRRSNSVNLPDNFRNPPAVVAQLMGFEEIPTASSPKVVAEKRRKLLGALEKCDQDLKALKKIIDNAAAVKESSVSEEGGVGVIKCYNITGECRSPVYVVEELMKPLSFKGTHKSGVRCIAQQHNEYQRRKKPRDIENKIKVKIESYKARLEITAAAMSSVPLWRSGTAMTMMIESVEEVCRDVAWGQKREVGRIGLVLQDCICKDLIEEFVEEVACFTRLYTLPLEACKRRLCF